MTNEIFYVKKMKEASISKNFCEKFLIYTMPHYQENSLLIVVAHFLVCAFT